MRRSCMELSVEIWLELLDEADALPDSRRPFEKMDGERQAGWLMFRDWLEEHGKAELVRLADRVTEGLLAVLLWKDDVIFLGGRGSWIFLPEYHPVTGVSGHLYEEPAPAPMAEPQFYRFYPKSEGRNSKGYPMLSFPSALAAWKWLFARVEEKGFLPARAEVGAA